MLAKTCDTICMTAGSDVLALLLRADIAQLSACQQGMQEVLAVLLETAWSNASVTYLNRRSVMTLAVRGRCRRTSVDNGIHDEY